MKLISIIICTVMIILGLCSCTNPLNYNVSEESQVYEPSYSRVEDIVPQNTDIDSGNKSPSFKTLKDRPVKMSEYYEAYVQKTGYDSLKSDSLTDLYEKLEAAMYSISQTPDKKGRYMIPNVKVFDCRLEEREITAVMQALAIDYPQVFWLNNIFSYIYEKGATSVQLYSLGDYEEIQGKINILSGRVSDIIRAIPGGLNEYEREKLINDYIIDNCTYDESIKNISDGWEAFTSYGAISDGSAICGGYSYGTQYLLNLLGINAVSVTGMGKNELHMWNQVKIDGLWYNLDTTWNDNGEISRYDYFNLSDEIIAVNHTLSPLYNAQTDGIERTYNVAVFDCESMEANYYSKECVGFGGFSEEKDAEIIARLAEVSSKGEEYFSIIVDKSCDYEETVNQFFYKSPYKFFYYIGEVNKFGTNKLMETEVSVLKKEFINVITVKLNYV